MSWSINFVGEPEKVAAAVEAFSERLTGGCKAEYDGALPHMLGLLKQNFIREGAAGFEKWLVRIRACGSGTVGRKRIDDETLGEIEPVRRSCEVTIETLFGAV